MRRALVSAVALTATLSFALTANAGVFIDTPPAEAPPTGHLVYVSVPGPWLDAHLAVDGVLQDLAAVFALVHALSTPPISPISSAAAFVPSTGAVWSFAPWFPATGGGGATLLATF